VVHDRVVAAVRGIVEETGVAVGASLQVEDSAFFRDTPRPAAYDGGGVIRPDITFRAREDSPFPVGAQCLDVTVVGTTASPEVGASVRAAEQGKERQYAGWVAARPGTTFTPLAVDTYGCFGDRFVRFLRFCARHSVRARLEGELDDEAVHALELDFRGRVLWALHSAQSQHVRRRICWRDRRAADIAVLRVAEEAAAAALRDGEPSSLADIAAAREPEI